MIRGVQAISTDERTEHRQQGLFDILILCGGNLCLVVYAMLGNESNSNHWQENFQAPKNATCPGSGDLDPLPASIFRVAVAVDALLSWEPGGTWRHVCRNFAFRSFDLQLSFWNRISHGIVSSLAPVRACYGCWL
jgi:hypothetical protein